MHDLESEWPAHNQGKTLGWKAREKTQHKQTNQLQKLIHDIADTQKWIYANNTKENIKGNSKIINYICKYNNSNIRMHKIYKLIYKIN